MTTIERLDGPEVRADMQLLMETDVCVTLDGFTWMCVLGALQLACRHPSYIGPSSDIVRQVAANIQAEISLNERIGLLLDMGWDPAFDVDQEAPT